MINNCMKALLLIFALLFSVNSYADGATKEYYFLSDASSGFYLTSTRDGVYEIWVGNYSAGVIREHNSEYRISYNRIFQGKEDIKKFYLAMSEFLEFLAMEKSGEDAEGRSCECSQ